MLDDLTRWIPHSRRVELRRDRLLRKIDHDVETAIAFGAQTPMGQIVRADIWHNTTHWALKYPRSRRLPAVDDLKELVEGDLNNQLTLVQLYELRQLTFGHPLDLQSVKLHLMCAPLPPQVFAQPYRELHQHLRAAERIWSHAYIRFSLRANPQLGREEQLVYGGKVLRKLNDFPLKETGALGSTGDVKLVTEVLREFRGHIHVFYVHSISTDMSIDAAKTERRAPPLVTDALIKIGADHAREDTLAHELGHALLDEGGHHPNPGNLMATGRERQGSELTAGQVIVARNSTYCGA